jgi:hypothetical protein
MKKLLLAALGCTATLFVMPVLSGCLKDTYTKTYHYTYYVPVYKTSQDVRDNIKSNPSQPIEKAGKIYIKGNYIFLNDIDKGIHVIDNSNPSLPQQVAFINIPGNMDLAVKGNTLYADLYTDLVAIDISNPRNVVLKKVVSNVFPYRYYNSIFRPDSSKVIASWEKKDTTVTEKYPLDELVGSGRIYMDYAAFSGAESQNKSSASVSPYGVGGSMARFTIINQRLYTVGDADLSVFNISDTESPSFVAKKNMGASIETIYPFADKLFIGSQTGMFIYDISSVDNPVMVGQFSHVESCDPVITDGQFAYVTLRTGTTCARNANQLEVLKLTNLINPVSIKTYPMTNPFGLSKEGSTLFICDGKAGLKIYDAHDVTNLQLKKLVSGPETYDIVTLGGLAILVAKDGLYQYDYSNLNDIRLLSKMTIQN